MEARCFSRVQWSIIQSGIKKVVAEVSTSEEFLKRQRASMLKTKAFFEEAGIEYVEAFVEEVQVVTKGMRSYPRKQRRSVRRQNHIARDLRSPIFRMRVIDKRNSQDNWRKELSQEDYED